MALNLDNVMDRGGRRLIDLLDYCVRSAQMDPVFLFLVREYRAAATTPKAVALYESFCQPQALARLSVHEALPPYNLLIDADMRRLITSPAPARPTLAPREMLDAIAAQVAAKSSAIRRIRRDYRVRRSPTENLPDGRMNEAQRHFVDRVWEPLVRPRLTSAGFWRMATIA
ncbi:MAG TPA: hypothetical protein VIK18_24740 [Pirellulales bacterium]